jgi:hypothetical protein
LNGHRSDGRDIRTRRASTYQFAAQFASARVLRDGTRIKSIIGRELCLEPDLRFEAFSDECSGAV